MAEIAFKNGLMEKIASAKKTGKNKFFNVKLKKMN
jgi:hypothetical protein